MHTVFGRRADRVLGAATAVLASSCFLLLVAPYASADTPQIDIQLSATTLSATVGGTPLTDGTAILAGSYVIDVADSNAPFENPGPSLVVSGPGVSLPPNTYPPANAGNNLNDNGMGAESSSQFGPYTFQAGSSYMIEDTNIGPSSLITFTASLTGISGGSSTGSSSTGSSSSGSSSTGTSSTGSSSTGSSSSGSGTSSGSQTSSSPTILGTLSAGVSATGKATLSFHGRAIKTLKAGLYTLVVDDHSTRFGLIVGGTGKRQVTLSGVAAVGKTTHSLTLTSGKWFFESTTHGPKTSFSVTT